VNLYQYANGNPVMNTDPSGEFVRRAVRAVGNVVNSATRAGQLQRSQLV